MHVAATPIIKTITFRSFFFLSSNVVFTQHSKIHMYKSSITNYDNFFFFKLEKKKRKIQLYGSKHTLMAVVAALPTSPGPACNVPNPTEGILAPVFNSKIRISFAIFSQNTLLTLARSAAIYSQSQAKITKSPLGNEE